MIPGVFAFLLMFLGDLNDLHKGKPLLRLLFPSGIFLLTISMGSEIMHLKPLKHPWMLAPASVFLVLLIYTLFFALSADEAYVTQKKQRAVCQAGIYGICRHPGIWWFTGMCLCLWGTGGLSVFHAAGYCLLDLMLVCFEDRCVFPAVLSGYMEYCDRVPFLVPRFRAS